MKRFLLSMVVILWASSVHAANWYVDNVVSSSGNGQSWATAWKHISNIDYISVNAGDTIYISGGTISKTYNEPLGLPKSGTAGKRITISSGQDTGHNGTVIFEPGSSPWLSEGNLSYVHITGNVGRARHMKVNGTGFRWKTNSIGTDTISNVRLSYIDFPNTLGGFKFSNGTTMTALEFDHLFIEKLYSSDILADDVFYNVGGLTHDVPYDSHLIHHNTIYLPANGSFGDDGIKWGSGWSFYNNHVKVIIGTYPGKQHADVVQINLSHYKIYNNIFEDVGESIIFHSQLYPGNPAGLLIYNNLFVNSHKPASSVARGIDLLVQGAAGGSTFTDFIVANNTWVDWTMGVFAVRMSGADSYTNCYVKNNLFKNSSGGGGWALAPGVGFSNNSSLNSDVQFVSYTEYAVATNDLHLTAGDKAGKNLGVTLASPMSAIDKDGVVRPQGSDWDLGAYEFGGLAGTTAPNPPGRIRVE